MDTMLHQGREVFDEPGDAGHDSDVGCSDDDRTKPRRRTKRARFESGEKSESFSRAFAKIVAKADAVKEVAPVPILAGSKSVLQRVNDEALEVAEAQAGRSARQELKALAHISVPRRGEDPQLDAREKAFTRLATRGVVLLFNAIARAQKQTADAEASGAKKPTKIGQAAFFAQLKAGTASVLGGSEAAGERGGHAFPQSTEPPAAGWKVLQESFTGLAGRNKMKDWDRKADDDGAEKEDVEGSTSPDDDEDDGDDDGGW